jgi:hypothetical protein
MQETMTKKQKMKSPSKYIYEERIPVNSYELTEEQKLDLRYWPKLKLRKDNFGFDWEILEKAVGRGYDLALKSGTYVRVMRTSKSSKKTTVKGMEYWWNLCNIEGWNGHLLKNTITGANKTILNTLSQARQILVNDYGLTRLLEWKLVASPTSHGVYMDAKSKKHKNELRVITSLSMKDDNITGGMDIKDGFHGAGFYDEPIEFQSDDKKEPFNYKALRGNFAIFLENFEKGIHYRGWIETKSGEKVYLCKNITLALNGWDQNSWVSLEYLNPNFPWKDEYLEWYAQDYKNNYQIEYLNQKYLGGLGIYIMYSTKFINEFMGTAERIKAHNFLNMRKEDCITASELENYNRLRATILGADFIDANVPFIFRPIIESISSTNTCLNLFPYNYTPVQFSLGYDAGKRDRTVLTLSILYKLVNYNGEQHPQKYVVRQETLSFKLMRKANAEEYVENVKALGDMMKVWKNNYFDKYNYQFIETRYDDHAPNDIVMLKNVMAEQGITLNIAPYTKTGVYQINGKLIDFSPTGRSQHLRNLIRKGILILDLNNKLLLDELNTQLYALNSNNDRIRDEKHGHQDFQDSMWASIQPIIHNLEIEKF